MSSSALIHIFKKIKKVRSYINNYTDFEIYLNVIKKNVMPELLNKKLQHFLSLISQTLNGPPCNILIFGSNAKVVLEDLVPEDLWGLQKIPA